MREHAVLPAGDEHHRELQPLGGVQGHQSDHTRVVLRDAVGVGDQRDSLQEFGENPHLWQVLIDPCVLVLLAQRRSVGAVDAEFMCDADQFVEVVQTCEVLRIVGGLQLPSVTGPVEDRLDEVAQFVTQVTAQAVEQFDEGCDRLLRAAVQHRHPAFGRVRQRIGETGPGVLGMDSHTGLGPVTDAAAGGIEYPSQADRITGVVQHAQIGDDVANLLALVEPNAADDLVGDTGADEDLFQRTRGVVGAVEDRDVVIGDVPGPDRTVDEAVDLRGDEAGLVVLVVGDIADDQLAVAGIGPQPLLPPAGVAGDHRIGRRQDGLGGPVVLFQQNRCGAGEVAFEVFDVADGGAAEGVDRLVGVAHHAQLRWRHRVGVRGRDADEFADQDILRVVGVLVLVDHDVPETTPVVLGDLRVALQYRHRLPDQIVEVQRVGGAQATLILGVHLGDDAGEVVGVRFQPGDGLFGRGQFVLQIGDRGGQQPGRITLDIDTHIAADHQQQATGIVGVVDREVGVQPGQQRGLVTQDPHAGGMEGRHPHIAGPGADQLRHPFAHLGGGLVGEGDGQDLPGTHVAGSQQVGDPPGEHRRLSRTRSGDDQQRSALVQHGLTLLGVQAVEQLGRARGWPDRGPVSHLHTHFCPNLPPSADRPLRRHATGWQTQYVNSQCRVLFAQDAHRRFFYGYRSAVPVEA